MSFYGLAQGTARGGVPSARIAAYKVCGSEGCSVDGILAAFDDAIADGVDIITISIASETAPPFHEDPIAIGAFHAMEKGILTSNSAGNYGPAEGSVSSVAPWILSVAASSTDRRIIDKVVLGNGRTLVGSSANTFELNGTSYPLIEGKDALRSSGCVECEDGCLDPDLVKGKIVVCRQANGSIEAHHAGAIGAITSTTRSDVSFTVPLPATSFSSKDYDAVQSYLNSVRTAQLWENEDLKAFPIFPRGVRYILGKIRDKATFPIFLQNFSEDKSTSNLACKSDAVFPKSRRILS